MEGQRQVERAEALSRIIDEIDRQEEVDCMGNFIGCVNLDLAKKAIREAFDLGRSEL